ncbi:MAG: beta-ureidopropionase / N-carbamoyl-L-amino-acid hydrolase [Gaiellales bacterium]|nr:beta-ureidopropionase / N-carbamoyl-L-amino-acid hydrolase [Gaiellales bacterium]
MLPTVDDAILPIQMPEHDTLSGPALLRIDGDRLWASLMALAEVGPAPGGGSHRVALTDADRDGQALFAGWAEAAGCTVSRDRIGNLFAERPGTDLSRPPVLVGSHLDTQPNGGRFDGTFGALAALEIVRTLNDAGVQTLAPVVIVSWSNEEGARFPLATTGSAVFCGALALEDALAQRALDGPSYGDELERLGLAGALPAGGRTVDAYFEGHIEQGPRLEEAGAVIGVVLGGQGLRALRATITGSESHSGTTPMEHRRDALVTAARIVEGANRFGRESEGTLVTVGQLTVEPNSRSVIPGRVELVIDIRNPDAAALDRAATALVGQVRGIVEADGLELDVVETLNIDPVPFDAECNRAIEEAASALGHASLPLVSGAVHDAMYLARLCPTALMFVPCRDGISHHPAEYAAPGDVAAGCDVLLQAVLGRAGVATA